MWSTKDVWHMEFWFSVVELQMLYPTWGPRRAAVL